ncbi:MAG: DUF1566 domain-containing protein [Deltaproteobacteria bacterium]|nr:DUF1566 domain-containing protein [Deltaproteobacteria bacterium]
MKKTLPKSAATALIVIALIGIYCATQVLAGASMSMKSSHRPSQVLKTGQTTSYATGDDGDLELGVARSYTIYTTGQYSGTTNIVINGKTHALSNNCVRDNRTGLMWARYVPTADIGPAASGELFWKAWTITKTDISFVNGTGKIHSVAGDFSVDALCAGRKFTISGTDSNDGTYTVSAIDANDITTVEGVADEAAGDTVVVTTVDDLIWDALAQANANSLGGYDDWRIPNYLELPTIVDLGTSSPCIDTTTFPSTPGSYHWTSSTRPDVTTYAFRVRFNDGSVNYYVEQAGKYYVRLCRG